MTWSIIFSQATKDSVNILHNLAVLDLDLFDLPGQKFEWLARSKGKVIILVVIVLTKKICVNTPIGVVFSQNTTQPNFFEA